MSTFLYEARSRSGEFFAGAVEAADKRDLSLGFDSYEEQDVLVEK